MSSREKEHLQALIDSLQPTCTLPRDPKDGFWLTMQNAILDAYAEHANTNGEQGGQAIIMAGPPGAGKSQAVAIARDAAGAEAAALGLTEDGFITIDADDIKHILLGNPVPDLDIDPELLSQARQHWDALITQHAPGNLADGQPVLRGELSTLVHPLSTAIADRVRGALLVRSFNIKIEGTLQWLESPTIGQGPNLVRELDDAGYTKATIVAVDAPRELCLAGAHQRWQEPRSRGDHTARFTPDTAIDHMFDGETSRCIDNARTTHDLARQDTALETANLIVVHRTTTPPTIEHTDQTGKTHSLDPAADQKLSAAILASRPPTKTTPTQTTKTTTQSPATALKRSPKRAGGPAHGRR